jgi:hypothetical protein
VQAGGMVAALEAAYDKAGGCSSVNNILDGEQGGGVR